MNRKDFLLMCQECARLPDGVQGTKVNVPGRLKVIWKGSEYYPHSYSITFKKDGEPIHTACLHDLKANSLVYAALESVEKVQEP